MKISVIVLMWNGAQYLDACLGALLAQDCEPFQIIAVDNASTDDSVVIADKYRSRLQIVRNECNLGFAGGNNVGIGVADGDVVVLLNQDTVVQPGWLDALSETFGDPTIGIVGCKALYMDGKSIQHAGGIVRADDALTYHVGWHEIDTGQYDAMSEPDYVTGAAFAIHRRVLEKLGGLDEGFFPAFYEEIDYCYRARRAGFRIVYQPRAVLLHHETASLPSDGPERVLAQHRNRLRFVLRDWTTDQLRTLFVCERQTVANGNSVDALTAYARAYWDNLVSFPFIVADRRRDPTLAGPITSGESQWLASMLQSLRRQAHDRLFGLLTQAAWSMELPSSQAPGQATVAADSVDIGRLNEMIDKANTGLELRESVLGSQVPVVGPIIKAFRKWCAHLILEPYFRPILRQQAEINRQVNDIAVETVRLIAALQEENGRLAQQNEALARQDKALARMLDTLNDDLAGVPQLIQALLDHHADS